MRLIYGVVYILLGLLFTAPSGHCQSFEKLKVIKLSAADQSAVIRGEDGKLKVVSTGQSLAPYGRITVIEEDCIVFEKAGSHGRERYIIRPGKNGQRIQKTIQASGHETGLKRPEKDLPEKK